MQNISSFTSHEEEKNYLSSLSDKQLKKLIKEQDKLAESGDSEAMKNHAALEAELTSRTTEH